MSDRVTTRRFLTTFAIGSGSGLLALALLSLIFPATTATIPKGVVAGLISGFVFLFALVISRPKKPAPHDARWTFSLRTLFLVMTVVAFLGNWVAIHVNWIWQRHGVVRAQVSWEPGLPDSPPAPLGLRLLGEKGVGTVFYDGRLSPGEQTAEITRLRNLFPESFVAEAPKSFDPLFDKLRN